jgi:tetratricopeptide (TPR) repeat protein
MPGRFSSLEFDEHNRDQGAAGQERPVAELASAAGYIAKARAADQWGEYESALRMYTRALREERSAIAAWVGQVQMLVLLDECPEARMWSDKALELFRNNGELLAAKAQACLRMRDWRAGIACSDASLISPGTSAWRWQIRGETLLAQGRAHYDECFQKALAESTADWFDHLVIARIYLYYRRITSAMAYAQQAAALRPTHGYVWFVLGDCQRALGLKAAAQASYQHCLESRGDYLPALQAVDRLEERQSVFRWLACLLRRWSRR